MGAGGDHFGLADRVFSSCGPLRWKMVFAFSACIAPATLDCWWASSPCITGPERRRLTAVFPTLTGTQQLIVCLLLLLAAAGKAAQVPFSGWLPRAMEGPTPSSAIFYGAISIHAGAYLLLRAQPLLAQSGLASALVIMIGVAHRHPRHHRRTRQRRRQNFARLRIADASRRGVCRDRTRMEMDRRRSHPGTRHGSHDAVPARAVHASRLSPDALRDRRRGLADRQANRGICFPERVQLWLYRWAFDRGHLDTILDRWVIDPLLQSSNLSCKAGSHRDLDSAGRAGATKVAISLHGPAGQGGD